MSFIDVAGPHYIKRTIVYMNSFDRVPAQSTDGYTFTWSLEEELTNVFAIELAQFLVPRGITTTFLGQYDLELALATGTMTESNSGSNMMFDIEITNEAATVTKVFEFSFDGDDFVYNSGRIYKSAEQIRSLVENAVDIVLGNSTDPVINSANYDSITTLDENNRLLITVPNRGPPTYARVRLLFGTGPNRDNQASTPLGFIPNQDTSTPVAANNYGAYAPFSVNIQALRYVNLFVDNATELSPLARVYTVDEIEGYVNPCDLAQSSRIMKNTIHNMKDIKIRVRSPDGFQLPYLSEIGLYFNFVLYSITQTPKVPNWVVQRLSL